MLLHSLLVARLLTPTHKYIFDPCFQIPGHILKSVNADGSSTCVAITYDASDEQCARDACSYIDGLFAASSTASKSSWANPPHTCTVSA